MKFVARALTCALLLTACEQSDVGKACPPKDGSTNSASSQPADASEVNAPADIRNDPVCESFWCLSTQVRNNYCSDFCRSDRSCPDGFVCSEVQPVGPNAGKKYCVLQKPCSTNNDCPKDKMVCREVQTSVPNQPAHFCDLK